MSARQPSKYTFSFKILYKESIADAIQNAHLSQLMDCQEARGKGPKVNTGNSVGLTSFGLGLLATEKCAV